MSRYKISWRMNLSGAKEQDFEQLLELLTEGESVSDEMWLFNSEPTNFGYDPLPEVVRKTKDYNVHAAKARKKGVRIGINPWPTFGDEGQNDLTPRELPFQPMVGWDGVAYKRVACPISPEFLEYSKERYKAFARGDCDFVWVDDDCRFTHLSREDYPCFCPRCVQGFEGGKFADRESLVAALNAPENRELRRKWSAYGAKRLADYCAAVREAVDEVNPAIETPFMSVGYSHTSYAGDYIKQCMTALRAKAGRPGHGFYWDETPMGMFTKVYDMSRQVVNMPESTLSDVQYEEESHPMSPLNKTAETRFMEMALSIWGGCTGIAMNHVHNAGGPRPYEHLRHEVELLRKNRSFFDRYLTFAQDLKQSGIWAAFSEWMMSGMKVGEKGWFNEYDSDYNDLKFVNEWPCFGIPVTSDPSGTYATLLQGKMAHVFSDEELEEIFRKPVIVDGLALEALWERGWGERTGVRIVRSATDACEKMGETAYNGEFAGSVRTSLFGIAYDLEPICEGVEVLGYNYRPLDGSQAIGITKFGNVIVLGYNPYKFTGTPGHMTMMRNLQKAMGARVWLEPKDSYSCPRVSTWVRADDKRAAVLLINSETAPSADFDVCFRSESASKAVSLGLNREDHSCVVYHEEGCLRVRIDTMRPWEMRLILID